MNTTRKSKMKIATDTAAADRFTLNSIREAEEMLASLGKLSAKEIADSQALRDSVGARPLRLDDARVFDSSSVPTTPSSSPSKLYESCARGRVPLRRSWLPTSVWPPKP